MKYLDIASPSFAPDHTPDDVTCLLALLAERDAMRAAIQEWRIARDGYCLEGVDGVLCWSLPAGQRVRYTIEEDHIRSERLCKAEEALRALAVVDGAP